MHRWLSEQRPRTTSAGRTPACSRTPQAIDTKALPPAIATLGMIRTALFQKVRATRTFFLVEFTGYRRSASPLDNEGRGLKHVGLQADHGSITLLGLLQFGDALDNVVRTGAHELFPEGLFTVRLDGFAHPSALELGLACAKCGIGHD